MKKRRCRKTALSGYYACFSRDLLLMPLGADTHTYKRSWTKRFQEIRWPRAPGLIIKFKNLKGE